MARGRLITIEGLDGAGKSTLASALAARARRARHARRAAARARRRGALRAHPRAGEGPRARGRRRAPRRCCTRPRARSSCSERVRPLLDAGVLVLLDRFVDSSLAYQGAGRGLGIERGARDQPVRHRRARARPHAAAAHRSRRPGARASASARASPTAWSARTSASSRRSPPPTTSSPAPSPSASARSTPRSRPSACCADALRGDRGSAVTPPRDDAIGIRHVGLASDRCARHRTLRHAPPRHRRTALAPLTIASATTAPAPPRRPAQPDAATGISARATRTHRRGAHALDGGDRVRRRSPRCCCSAAPPGRSRARAPRTALAAVAAPRDGRGGLSRVGHVGGIRRLGAARALNRGRSRGFADARRGLLK